MGSETEAEQGYEIRDADHYAEFVRILKERVADGEDLEHAIEYAEYDSRFFGLDALFDVETELRKHDLAQIGYVLLGMIGEANHGSWDGVNRPALVHFNAFFKELIQWFPHHGSYKDAPDWGFGGGEYWDNQGVRHTKGS